MQMKESQRYLLVKVHHNDVEKWGGEHIAAHRDSLPSLDCLSEENSDKIDSTTSALFNGR